MKEARKVMNIGQRVYIWYDRLKPVQLNPGAAITMSYEQYQRFDQSGLRERWEKAGIIKVVPVVKDKKAKAKKAPAKVKVDVKIDEVWG